MAILELDAFIRTIEVNFNTPHTFFLGAGASVSSGIPSATTLIWDWKRKIFLSNNPGLEDQFSELSLPSIQNRLQNWLDNKGGFPPINSIEEYGFYIEKCFPLVESRRRYFENIIKGASPYSGYKLLSMLAEADFVRSVWTTNFDGLVAKAAANFHITTLEVAIDTRDRLPIEPQKGQLLCVSLHGDYRYDALKNTSEELKQQDHAIRSNFISQVRKNPIIVCGYSGRDQSVMEAFKEAYSSPSEGILYWCGYGDEISESVQEILEIAEKSGHKAFFIPTQGFDILLQRLSLYCLHGDLRNQANQLISNIPEKSKKTFFRIEDNKISGIIKSNMFEITVPSDVFEVSIQNWPKDHIWKWINSIAVDDRICAVPFRKKILCLGNSEEIKERFQDRIIEQVQRVPISDVDLLYEDGIVISLLRKALISSIAQTHKLKTDNDCEIWESKIQTVSREGEYTCEVYPSVLLFLRKIGKHLYLILKPSLYIIDRNGKAIPRFTINKIKNAILGYQHNKEFNTALNKWRDLLLPESKDLDSKNVSYEFPPQSGIGFEFKIRRAPIFGSYSSSKSFHFTPPTSVIPLIKQKGFLLDEPDLLFSNKQSSGIVKEGHPLVGLVNNRPYDFSLTTKGLMSSIRLGIIVPLKESLMLSNYLLQSQSSLQPGRTEQDYLIPYPGFSSAFGIPLEIPRQGDTNWVNCPEIQEGQDRMNVSIELSRMLISSIESMIASSRPQVIIIFIPSRWKQYREVQGEDNEFDLHDYVKAFCAQKGIATQFLEEDTLQNENQCRVWWWLSLAIYAKAMRTPWVINNLDPDTAFVGLGYSFMNNKEKGGKIVLGCSHIYNSHGEGLQYRLSPIQDPVWINDNPFMSYEDSRRLGETIRQLFFESSMKLPKRVVIHKQTQFMKDEQNGLRTGLGGVDEVEMLEINFDSALRYISSYFSNDRRLLEDNFPVRRGMVMQLDDYSFLIWVHGAADAVNPKFRYFKGKRRIPTPIIVRRFSGNSDIRIISNEILALSKMDWNSADLYSQLPSTILSSKQIAKIGSLLQRFGPLSYDYRLFI